MPRFKHVQKGTRAENPVEVPGVFTEKLDEAKQVVKDERGIAVMIPVIAACRPLDGEAEAAVLAGASDVAVAAKQEPVRGNPVYDLACMKYTLLHGYVDVDSPKENREPFFESFDEVSSLEVETIAYLYEHQETWQSIVSPYTRDMTADQLIAIAIEEVMTAGTEGPFARMSPGMRWSCMHIMACLLVLSPEARSLITSLFVESGGNWKTTRSRSSEIAQKLKQERAAQASKPAEVEASP